MNLTKIMLLAFAVHFSLIILGVAEIPFTDLYRLMTSGTWSGVILTDISSMLTAAAAVAVLIATVATRSDIWIFAGISILFLSFGAPLAVLWQQLATHSDPILATIVVGPMILIYVMAVIAFWRGRAS